MVAIIVTTVLFVAANVYLWSLPIGQTNLLLVAAPAGAVYFAWFTRMVMRD